MTDRVHPTRSDPVVAAVSAGVGGPVGSRAGRHPWWTPVRVVLALAALAFALGMVQKSPCYEDTWSDGQQRYSQMCYSDLPYLYTGRGFVELAWPYDDDAEVRGRYEVMEYPVGISYVAYGTAWATHLLTGSPDLAERFTRPVSELFGDEEVQGEIRWFVVLSAVGLALATLLTAWFLAGVDRRRPWDAAMFAASPALALTALVNWDLLAVVFVAGAVWAWARGRPVLTGVLIGLGTATKLYPLFLLGAVLVVCVCDKRVRDFLVTTAAAAGAWLLANAPAYLSGPEEWKVFWTFNSERGPDLGSLWLVVAQATDTAIDASTVNTWSWLLFGAWCVGVFVLGVLAPKTPRLAQLGFLIVAGFLLVNKVYSPQYVLWLLPLAVLARPRWRDQLVWQGSEVLYFAAVWWYLGGYLAPGGGGDAGFYWLAILVRVAGELFLIALVVRDVLVPRHDPVRIDDAVVELGRTPARVGPS
ncbi:glycosyltransferase family 87 protein [Nocardioides dongkuii]|uniref:glycosyltransferase family 87 protein n=1 Tax=Nocardioides dongkuii TaxID=2760089 RepID=UPI0015FB4612|nr:glycosyltransferase 87 family protein [Nocardioides dongkuii]